MRDRVALPEWAGRKCWEETKLRAGSRGWIRGAGATRSLLRSVGSRARLPGLGHHELERLTLAELYDEARGLGVHGLSGMNKVELAEAIRRAQARNGIMRFWNRSHDGDAVASRRWKPPAWTGILATLQKPGARRRRILPTARRISGTKRFALLAAIIGLCGALGLLVAIFVVPDEGGSALVRRVHNGVTETGRIETVTTPTGVKRVIRWRTRKGKIVTETVRGPLRVKTLNGQTFYVAGPSQTVFGTTTLPGGTVVVTGPGVTSIATLPVTVVETLPVTETVRDTVTEVVTVHDTVTVQDTVTEVVTEIVTVTAPAPGP